jgi:gentisate 1,2-dioxygenase
MATQGVKPLGEFEADIAALNLRGQWQLEATSNQLSDGPKPAGIPFVWTWDTMAHKIAEAGSVIPTSSTARRALACMNPGLQPRPGTSQTLVATVQMVLPHEIAWAHRHSMAAIRFAIEGSSALFTSVNGERFVMEPHDLILTPAWTWHDHQNESDRPGLWLDALDVPLVFGLNQAFFQDYGESLHPLVTDAPAHPPYRYAWNEMREQLAAGEPNPHDGVLVEYTNPATGGSALPTLGCYAQLLRGGFSTEEHRHTSSAVYHVVQGSGKTVCGETVIEWSERDTFVVPNWSRHRHVNDAATDAILFSVSDKPALSALGLYREGSP